MNASDVASGRVFAELADGGGCTAQAFAKLARAMIHARMT